MLARLRLKTRLRLRRGRAGREGAPGLLSLAIALFATLYGGDKCAALVIVDKLR